MKFGLCNKYVLSLQLCIYTQLLKEMFNNYGDISAIINKNG